MSQLRQRSKATECPIRSSRCASTVIRALVATQLQLKQNLPVFDGESALKRCIYCIYRFPKIWANPEADFARSFRPSTKLCSAVFLQKLQARRGHLNKWMSTKPQPALMLMLMHAPVSNVSESQFSKHGDRRGFVRPVKKRKARARDG